MAQVFTRGSSITRIRTYRQGDDGTFEVVTERNHAGGTTLGAMAEPIQRALWGR